MLGVVGNTKLPNDSETCTDCGLCTCTQISHWVLRDKDGNRINAMVEPRCGLVTDSPANKECLPPDFGAEKVFPCVRVIDHEQRPINLQYDLETGSLERCMKGAEDPDRFFYDLPFVEYATNDCSGPPYDKAYVDGDIVQAQSLEWIEGDIWYLSREGCLIDADTFYFSSEGECIAGGTYTICPFHPVPQWVRDLLPNPPYTLEVETL